MQNSGVLLSDQDRHERDHHGRAVHAIGMIAYRDEGARSMAMYSPTQVCLAEYDHGHFVFIRRTRELPETLGARTTKLALVQQGAVYRS